MIATYEEVPEPVLDGRSCVCLGASLQRVDFGGVEPWQGEPGSTEEGDVEEQSESSTRSSTSLLRRDKTGEGDDHRNHLSECADKEELTTTKALNEVPGSAGEDSVDNHVDATKQESHVVSGAKRGHAENREVVDDGIATRKLLHHLRRSTQDRTAAMLGPATSPQVAELCLACASSSDRVDDDVHLQINLGVISGQCIQSSQNRPSLVLSVVAKKPAGRLGHLDHEDQNDKCENALEGNGESPREVIRAVSAAVIDPVGDEGTNGHAAALETDDFATVLCFRASGDRVSLIGRSYIWGNLLGLVGGDSGCVDAVTDTSDAAPNDELSCSTAVWRVGCDLDNDTDDHNTGTKEDGFAAAKSVTCKEDEAGTEETSDSVDSSNETFVGAVSINLGESFDECGGGNDSTHDTLIITKEQEIGSRNDSDKQLESLSRLAPICGDAIGVVLVLDAHCFVAAVGMDDLERGWG